MGRDCDHLVAVGATVMGCDGDGAIRLIAVGVMMAMGRDCNCLIAVGGTVMEHDSCGAMAMGATVMGGNGC